MRGARAVQESILDAFPRADISVSIVWTEMVPNDNADAVRAIAQTIRDARVRHFYDPRETHLAGHAFAKGILYADAGPAWDIYFFYDKESEWRDGPPRPVEWMHQLWDTQADAKHFHHGQDLVVELRKAMGRVSGGT